MFFVPNVLYRHRNAVPNGLCVGTWKNTFQILSGFGYRLKGLGFSKKYIPMSHRTWDTEKTYMSKIGLYLAVTNVVMRRDPQEDIT